MKFIRRYNSILFITFLLFFIVGNFIFYVKLTEPKSLIAPNASIEKKILFYYDNLPPIYNRLTHETDNFTETFIRNIKKYNEWDNVSVTDLWKLANSWVNENCVINPIHERVGQIFGALKYTPIEKVDLYSRGTQLKLLLTLEGGQDVIFKPKWYEKDKIIEAPVYGGKDRYTSEIIAFYLSIILNLPFVPFTAERKLSLKNQVLPVASRQFLDTSFSFGNRTCIYGKCHYCSKKDAICGNEDDILMGAVIFHIQYNFKVIPSPWMRTYKSGKKAPWEMEKSYCNTVQQNINLGHILQMIDIAIFDFFIQNGDRHHYEIMNGRLMLLDNGKGLGNPYKHFIDILAPLYQCCFMRKATRRKLLSLVGNKLSFYLKKMPEVRDFVHEDHLKAIDERLLLIFATMEYCKNERKMIYV